MLTFAVGEALRNARRYRNLSAALAGATGLVLLLTAFLIAVATGVTSRLAAWERSVEVVAFLEEEGTPAQRDALAERLRALPGVATVEFTSSEAAWREFIAQTGAPGDLESAADTGLFPASFTLRLRPGHLEPRELDALVAEVGRSPGVGEVRYAKDLLARYAAFRRTLWRLLGVGVGLLLLLLLGLNVVTIRLGLGSREQEIRAFVWEGATGPLLHAILITEAALQGLLGSAWAAALFVAGDAVARSLWGVDAPREPWLLPTLWLAGPAVCALSSLLATQSVGRRAFAAGLLLLVLVGGLPAGAAEEERSSEGTPRTTQEYDAEQLRARLRDLRSDREQALAQASELGTQSLRLLGELEELGRIEQGLTDRIQQTHQERDGLVAEIEALTEQIGASEVEYRAAGEQVVRLSRLLGDAPPPMGLVVLLSDAGQGQAIRVQETVDRLLQRRLAAFAELERAQRTLRRQRTEREAARTQADSLSSELERDLATRSETRAARQAVLRQVQSEQALAVAAAAELDAAMAELRALLANLEIADGGAFYGPVPFPELRGALPWPLSTGRVVRTFGRRTEEFWTILQHDGWLLEPTGGDATIRAIHDGVVRYVDWLHGYGKLIVLDHGGGYQTLYGHCEQIVVTSGELVRAGQPLGVVGTTSPTVRPSLFFGVRVQGEARDPAEWLVAAEG